ncbi:MAG TPA: hypothetical protein VFU27_07800 [Terriglobales bacterium]|nr:hypothetical protein [Terriglobales bacterium]
MGRCIAFDKPTAQAISRNLHLLTVCDSEGDPLQSALHSNSTLSLLAIPADTANRVLIATFRRAPRLAVPPSSPDPVGFEASGFLGLSDEPVYENEPPAARKWWQKILE